MTQIPKPIYSAAPAVAGTTIVGVADVPAGKVWLLTMTLCNDSLLPAAVEVRRTLGAGAAAAVFSQSRTIPAGVTIPIPALMLRNGDALTALQTTLDAVILHVDAMEVPNA